MSQATALTRLLRIRIPIIQAPMAGASTPELVAAVSNAGALGGFGASDTPPAQLREIIRAIRQRTQQPFIVNLYLDHVDADDSGGARASAMRGVLDPLYAALAAGAVPAPRAEPIAFREQLRVVLEEQVPVLSTHFGPPPPDAMSALKANGITTLSTATTVTEARLLVRAGIDAVIAQGSEAGGHRGTFAAAPETGMIGTMALVPQVADAVRVPVVAAGGIMDARGIVAALALGAAGVQMGTAFIACPENDVMPAYRTRLLHAADGDTVVSRMITGRPARLIRNRCVTALDEARTAPAPFPVQAALTRPLRDAAAKRDDAEYLAMWAGQGAALAREVPAAQLVVELARGASELAGRLASSDGVVHS